MRKIILTFRQGLSPTMASYIHLMRLHKPIGFFLLLWPTLWAVWIAGCGHPKPKIVFIFIIGVLLMRSAGCVINDFADRHIDTHVARTKDRPLATKKITPQAALILFALLCLGAFLLVLQLNTLTLLLSIPAVALAAVYPFMKRITHLPQLVLGVAFAWGIPMAFAAQNGRVAHAAWVLMAATIFWTMAYDTEYAMVDYKDDLKIGVKSTAILWGRWDRGMIGVLQILTLTCLILINYFVTLGLYYQLAIFISALLMLYQQTLIRHRIPKLCFNAFLNNHWIGLCLFLGIIFTEIK